MSNPAFAPVGVVVFGVSTPFAYWGFNLVNALVEAIAGRTLHLHISSLTQLRDGFARRAGGSVVMTSDFPDADLAAFVCGAGLPMIVFSDAPATVLDWTAQSRGLGAFDAARLASRIYASLAPNMRVERKLVLAPGVSAEQAVAEIIPFLWPRHGRRFTAEAQAHLAESGRLAPPPQPAAPKADESRQAALEALAAYAPVAEGLPPAEIVWPLPLFTRPDARPWGAPFDLTGPARAVLFGPYMHLPVGDWTARVEFEVEDAVSGVEAMTDVRINEVVTEKSFIMPAKGIFAYGLDFQIADPHLPVEIRLFIQKSAIEGVFLPRSVRIAPRRLATAEPGEG
jgi:hypothetical protein